MEKTIRTLGEYQRAMDRFEMCGDGLIIPDLFLIIRIDAHRIGEEWEDFPESGYPFDPGLSRALIFSAAYLMQNVFRIAYAYVHGDEISVLLHSSESSGQRRRARLVSLVASGAASAFMKDFGRPVAFHARLSELPTERHAVDYFMWQRKVAARNVVARSLILALSAQGLSQKDIDGKISKLTEEERVALLAELGKPLASFSAYERYGASLWWEESKSGYLLNESSSLPGSDEAYFDFVLQRISGNAYGPGCADAPVRQAKPEPQPPASPQVQNSPRTNVPQEKFRLGAKPRRPR